MKAKFTSENLRRYKVILPDWKDVEISFTSLKPITIQKIIKLIFDDYKETKANKEGTKR